MRVAFLGPAGTNSDLACRELLPSAEGVPCFSIPEIFRSLLESVVDAALLPIENMIQGPVTETLDLLFEHSGKVYIADSALMRIQNAFGILPEGPAWPRKLRAIYSHDQPLRQCTKYLSEHCPDAEKITTASTAAAIQLVKENNFTDAAVLASPAALKAAAFHVVEEDVSDVPLNKTRFVLVRRGISEEHLKPEKPIFAQSVADVGYATSLVVDPGRDRKGLLFELLNVISIVHQVNILTIHSRPDTRGGVVFYFDLEGHPEQPNIRGCLAELRRFCSDATEKTTEIHILGVYPRSPFYVLPFRKIGLVGSAGVMGRWFEKFFQSAGIEVLQCDLNSGLPLSELAQRSDVVVLSVPMSSAAEVVAGLLPHLRSDQLVVENCSIKSCALPALDGAPAGTEVLGVHTMFAGDIPSIRDQNVVITKTARSGEKAQAFEDILYKHGARLHYVSIEDHDRIAACVQSLLQFGMLALADVLQNTRPLDELNVLSTPNFRNVMGVVGRVISQTDDLVFDLQLRNEYAAEMRKRFRDSVDRLLQALDSGDAGTVSRSLNASRKYIKGG